MAISSCQATSISQSWRGPCGLAPGKLAVMGAPPHSFPGAVNILRGKIKKSADVKRSWSGICAKWLVWAYLAGSPQRENIVGCGTHSGPAALPLCHTGVEHVELWPRYQGKLKPQNNEWTFLFSWCMKLSVHINGCLGVVWRKRQNDLLRLAPPISRPRLQLCPPLIRQSAGEQRAAQADWAQDERSRQLWENCFANRTAIMLMHLSSHTKLQESSRQQKHFYSEFKPL